MCKVYKKEVLQSQSRSGWESRPYWAGLLSIPARGAVSTKREMSECMQFPANCMGAISYHQIIRVHTLNRKAQRVPRVTERRTEEHTRTASTGRMYATNMCGGSCLCCTIGLTPAAQSRRNAADELREVVGECSPCAASDGCVDVHAVVGVPEGNTRKGVCNRKRSVRCMPSLHQRKCRRHKLSKSGV